MVWRIVSKAAKRAGIGKAVSCHWMRHAHASHALDRGAPIHLVESTLGHSSVRVDFPRGTGGCSGAGTFFHDQGRNPGCAGTGEVACSNSSRSGAMLSAIEQNDGRGLRRLSRNLGRE